MSESEGFVLQTAPFDARFPNTNQSKACFQNYVDHYRCINKKGEDFEPCKQASCPMKSRRARRAIDHEWIAKWDEQREAGKFPARLE
ncbi:BQ5605_C009g05656 [Microbotryum silenes-dioicae]|uniref:BQ5605_C009g05656 protein n=1 Tax=Microbotryum silenes-dioicae TaxID=796604 RepID=A0A2X0N0Q0_9BASI|nr:BQ5605_C009g05656 [Microbotryum silenes-dioicae]